MALDKRHLLSQLADQLRHNRSRPHVEIDSIQRLLERGLPEFRRDSQVDLGALVDVWSTGADGDQVCTLFLLPAGADAELPGRRRDERFAVVTPASVAGKALLGRRAGERIKAPLRGEEQTWTVLEVS